MTLIISSEARWVTAADPGRTSVPPEPVRPAPTERTCHRLRRRLARKCASILAGASMALGLTAARIPAASAQVASARVVPMGESADQGSIPATYQPP
jgi:hypothetical protein